MVSNIDFQRGLVESRRAYDNRILVQPNDSAAFDQQIISALWDRYAPSVNSIQSGAPSIWLQHLIKIPTRGIPLQLSLKAFAMTRVGYMNKDKSLALQGNLSYGHALNAVQKALSSEASMLHDDLFAAGFVLSVYEVAFPPRLPIQSRLKLTIFQLFESTTPSIAGWNNHLSGLKHLVLERGPQRHKTPIARALLEEFRISSVCIMQRHPHPYSEQ